MLKREGESQGTISLSCRHNTGLAPRPLYALQRSTMAGKGVSWYSTTSREAVIYPGTVLYLPLLGVVRCDSWTKATEEEAGFTVSPASVIFHGGLNYFFCFLTSIMIPARTNRRSLPRHLPRRIFPSLALSFPPLPPLYLLGEDESFLERIITRGTLDV